MHLTHLVGKSADSVCQPECPLACCCTARLVLAMRQPVTQPSPEALPAAAVSAAPCQPDSHLAVQAAVACLSAPATKLTCQFQRRSLAVVPRSAPPRAPTAASHAPWTQMRLEICSYGTGHSVDCGDRRAAAWRLLPRGGLREWPM
jgi:hypothetical protein